jgi:putative Holliday junction resolvase
MTIAAIDYGKRRLGIAATDLSRSIVYPAGVIERRSLKLDLLRLDSRLKELQATRVIVGLPVNMNGTMGPAARAAEAFAERLREITGLPVEVYDERLSTFEAEARLKTLPPSYQRQRPLDALAAMVILEDWLRTRAPGR